MVHRWTWAASLSAGLCVAAPAVAKPQYPCRSIRGCPTDVQVGSTTIVPSDERQFALLGDNFLDAGTEVSFGTNNFAALALPGFSVNFGGGPTSTLFISKNGLVSFGAPLLGYQNSSLSGLNLPVLAPYYAPLTPGTNDGRVAFGDVVVQFGSADVFADGGSLWMAHPSPPAQAGVGQRRSRP